jgi:hypothetical protein
MAALSKRLIWLLNYVHGAFLCNRAERTSAAPDEGACGGSEPIFGGKKPIV